MKTNEPEVMREIRGVRDRMADAVEREGVFEFYASLKGRAAKLMAQHGSPHPAPVPRSPAQRKAKRKALADALPEPAAIRELRRIRQEMRAEEKRVGRDKFWAEVNRQGKAFARRHGLRYVEAPSGAHVLHDKPGKK